MGKAPSVILSSNCATDHPLLPPPPLPQKVLDMTKRRGGMESVVESLSKVGVRQEFDKLQEQGSATSNTNKHALYVAMIMCPEFTSQLLSACASTRTMC